jgi:phage pi2 protein 07
VEKQIDKQEFMEFMSKAFDMGAKMDVMFYSGSNSEETAKELADEFTGIVGGEVKEVYSQDLKSRWFRTYNQHSIAVWHHNSNDQKYFKMLSGEKEETA